MLIIEKIVSYSKPQVEDNDFTNYEIHFTDGSNCLHYEDIDKCVRCQVTEVEEGEVIELYLQGHITELPAAKDSFKILFTGPDDGSVKVVTGRLPPARARTKYRIRFSDGSHANYDQDLEMGSRCVVEKVNAGDSIHSYDENGWLVGRSAERDYYKIISVTPPPPGEREIIQKERKVQESKLLDAVFGIRHEDKKLTNKKTINTCDTSFEQNAVNEFPGNFKIESENFEEIRDKIFEYSSYPVKLSPELLTDNDLGPSEPYYQFTEANKEIREGTTEQIFYEKLCQYFKERNIHQGKAFGEYYPDFIYQKGEVNLCLNIEIDEPYTVQEPIHCKGADDKRNYIFLKNGWHVIRFTEKQVINQIDSCCKEVAQLLKELNQIPSIEDFKYIPDLKPEPVWDYDKALEMKAADYRLQYLKNKKVKPSR